MRTNSSGSAEFYEAIGRSDVKDGTIMFSISVQQFGAPALDIDTIADESHKKFYPVAWERFVAAQNQVVEVAEENEEASNPELPAPEAPVEE